MVVTVLQSNCITMQGDLQKHLLTGDSRRAWEQWSSLTVELKVVRTAIFIQPSLHGWNLLHPCQKVNATHASCHIRPCYPKNAVF
jgi:hypothetical protein